MKPLGLVEMAQVWDLIGDCLPEIQAEGAVIDYIYKLLDNIETHHKYEQLRVAMVLMTQVSEDTVGSLSGMEFLDVLAQCLEVHHVLDYQRWRANDRKQ